MREPSWLGIDLGGTFIKYELVADDGVMIRSGKKVTPLTGQLDVVDAISGIVTELVAEGFSLAGVGIAVPGHLSPERDSITIFPNVPGDWRGFPLRSSIAKRSGLEVSLLNDARSFALAELELGAAAGASTAVFATIGTGIGGAVAVDGTVISSAPDSFGEIGHTTAVVDGDRCGCGSFGCVEAYAGGTNVLRRARERGVSIPAGADALTSLEKAARTDPLAAAVLEEAYDAFAVGMSSICAYTGAQLVIVGGAVAEELPRYLARTRMRLEHRQELLGPVEVRAASLGSRAGALGAALASRRAESLSNTERPNAEPLTPELEHM